MLFKIDRFPISSPDYYLSHVIALEEVMTKTTYAISCKELNISLSGGTRENTLNRLYNILAKLPIAEPIYASDKGKRYPEIDISKVVKKDAVTHECSFCISQAIDRCLVCGEYKCSKCRCECK